MHDGLTVFLIHHPERANGSILLEMVISDFPANNGLQQCAQLMPRIISLISASGCPQITVADAIQVRMCGLHYTKSWTVHS